MAPSTRLLRLAWVESAAVTVASSLLTLPADAANTSGETLTPVNSLAKGLTDKRVATVVAPTDIAFTPDGRGLITAQTGQLRVLHPQGLAPEATPVNRVTRFRLPARDEVVSGSARVIVDNTPSPASNHNSGDLALGADELPSITTGDVPADNPYVSAVGARRCTAPGGPGPGNGPCTETYASGFRNPFRMDIRAGNSTPWVNDVGQDTWEEINKVDAAADSGWNVRESFCLTGSTASCGPDAFSDPIYSYAHSNGCGSITGGAFVPKGTWKARFAGNYVFADFLCGSLWRLDRGADTFFTAKPLAPAANPVALTFGPSPQGRALCYAEYFSGHIRRITPS